jgi:anti-repressor protein
VGRGSLPTIINESGVCNLVLGGRKPAAKALKRWVTAEVLPSIRKTGGYGQISVAALVKDPATMPRLIQGYAKRTWFWWKATWRSRRITNA